MRKLGQRMRDQRLRVASRVQKSVRTVVPRDVERGVKELATNVEAVMHKLVRGELGGNVARDMDKFLTGFIRYVPVVRPCRSRVWHGSMMHLRGDPHACRPPHPTAPTLQAV